ncbi:MAG: hypothetical protein RL094_475 [Candidatus Parcubacteria bacterium]|jgi:DNA polymerase-3 subunit epsilon
MIVVDVETTGVNPRENSIVSIGAVDFNNPKDHFYMECHAWAGAIITDEALAINGYTRDQVRDTKKKSESEAIKEFLLWCQTKTNLIIAGQNVNFDLQFIEEACMRAGEKSPFGKRIMEMHTLCYTRMLQQDQIPPLNKGKSAVDSDFIMKYIGIPAEPKPHIAINGAKFEAEAFHRFIFKKPLFDEFKPYDIPDYL